MAVIQAGGEGQEQYGDLALRREMCSRKPCLGTYEVT